MSDDRAITVHVVRVFCDERDDHGNALGVVVDGTTIADTEQRQELAAELGFAETVFLGGDNGSLAIFTPTTELPFAGHPLVGTGWLLRHLERPVAVLRPSAGAVPTTADADGAAIEADPGWGPAWELRQLATPDAVDDLDSAAFAPDDAVFAWSWEDEITGRVRARAFAPALGITEDEATGSAALRLVAAVGRAVEIRQGRGSVIVAEPIAGELVRVGGRVVLDEVLTIRSN